MISGQKVWTSNAKYAQKTLLLARTTPFDQVTRKTKGMSLFMADLEPGACRLQEIDKLGHAVDSNSLFIDQLRVHRDDLIGQEGEGFYHILDGINPERIVIAAEAVGIGKAALARAIDYAKSRWSSGDRSAKIRASSSPWQMRIQSWNAPSSWYSRPRGFSTTAICKEAD